MAGVNKVIILGNLGQDPDVRYTADGRAIVNCNIATSESWKDKQSGEKREKTEWHRVVFFGGVAKVAAEYLKKGSKIYVEGKLQTRQWEDQQGQKKYTTEVVVDGFNGVMQMLDSRGSGGTANYDQSAPPQGQQNQPSYNPGGGGQQQPSSAPAAMEPIDDFDDDIPF